MSMEINGSYRHSQTSYVQEAKAEQTKEKQAADRAGKAKEADGGAKASAKTPDRTLAPHDEYVSSEKSGEKPSGLYRVGQDENGNRKVYYDVKTAGSENAEEKCTANTDRVDREIEQLKEKRKKLEQQLQSASGDEKKVKELESKLAQVERELSQKDNDAYRKQNSSVTA